MGRSSRRTRMDGERSRRFYWVDPHPALDVARKVGGLEHTRMVMRGEVPPAPICELVGFRFVLVESGEISIEFDPAEYHRHLVHSWGYRHARRAEAGRRWLRSLPQLFTADPRQRWLRLCCGMLHFAVAEANRIRSCACRALAASGMREPKRVAFDNSCPVIIGPVAAVEFLRFFSINGGLRDERR